jgi:hypothetical protein
MKFPKFGKLDNVFLKKMFGATLLFFVYSQTALGAPFGGDSRDFTSEERRQFTDDPDHFPRTTLPHLIPFGGAVWLDNGHLLMNVKETPDGWDSNKSFPPLTSLSPYTPSYLGDGRLVSVNVATREIKDTPYAIGHIRCFTENKFVLVGENKKDGRPTYYTGKYGDKLDRMDIETRGVPSFSGASCEQIKLGGSTGSIPLLPGQGFASVPLTLDNSLLAKKTVRLMADDGSVRAEITLPANIIFLNVLYVPFLGKYISGGRVDDNTHHSGLIFSTDGAFSYVDPPPFLEQMAWKYHGGGNFAMTKAGPVWAMSFGRSLWKTQGLYFSDGGRLLRLDDGIVGNLAVSPDGCKLLYDRKPENKILDNADRTLEVLDMCARTAK